MLSKFRLTSQKGFTLIELLIVVAIIGILAAIAIPQFSAYRKRGYNAAANSDLRNIRTGEEAMFADFQDYGGTANNGDPSAAGSVTLTGANTATTAQTFSLSPNVKVSAKVDQNAGGNTALKNAYFTAISKHYNGDNMYGVESDQTTPYRKGKADATDIVIGDNPGASSATNLATVSWITLQ